MELYFIFVKIHFQPKHWKYIGFASFFSFFSSSCTRSTRSASLRFVLAKISAL